MKTLSRLALVALLTLVAAWSGAAQTVKAGTEAHRTKLQQDTEIQGYPCAKGYAWLYADGKLENCAVSKEFVFGDAKLPVGSIIVLLQDGRPKYAMMQHDVEVAGVKCGGGNRLLRPSEGAMTVFYPSGKLKLCYLAGDQVVQGVPCRHDDGPLGILYDLWVKHQDYDLGIEFYQSGKLKSCGLSEDFGGQKKNTLWKSAAK